MRRPMVALLVALTLGASAPATTSAAPLAQTPRDPAGLIAVAEVMVPAAGSYILPSPPWLEHGLAGSPPCAVAVSPSGRRLALPPWRGWRGERRLPTRLASVEEHEAGWHLVIDTGPKDMPPGATHDGLLLRLDEPSASVVVGIEEPGDVPGTWRSVAEASLFRLGDDERLRHEVLPYPPTTAGRLRLDWPRRAGEPRLREVLLSVSVPQRTVGLRIVPVVADGDDLQRSSSLWRLDHEHGPIEVDRLELGWPGEPKPVAARLWSAADGRWQGALTATSRDSENGLVVALQREDVTTPLLLELAVADGAPPRPDLATAIAPPIGRRLVADEPGRHVLGCRLDGRVPEPDRDEPATELPPRPLEAKARPPSASRLPTALTGLAGPASDGPVLARVPLSPNGEMTAGVLTRVPLPPAIWQHASPRLSELRVVTGGRLVPHLLDRPPEPALVSRTTVAPVADGGGGSTVRVPLEDLEAPLVAAEVHSAAGPFVRPLRIALERPGPRTAPAERRIVHRGQWACDHRPPLSCSLQVALPSGSWQAMVVEIDDGQELPLPELELRLWRSQAAVVFPWPQTGQPELTVVTADRRAPRYDLQAVRGRVVHRTGQSGRVAEAITTSAPGRDLPSWALVAALAGGALALVLVLVRNLRLGATQDPR